MAVATGTVLAIAAVAGATAATVGTVGSLKNQAQAARFQRRAARIERDANNYQAARERREAIRQARIAYATQVQGAQNAGVSSSSGALGGQSSLISQTQDNISFLDRFGVLKDASATATSQANAASARAGAFGAVGQLGMQVFSAAGGTSAFKKG